MADSFVAMDGYKTFLASYNFNGARWNLEIAARDEDEARERLARIAFAKLDGELKAKIAVPSPSVWRNVIALLKSTFPAHNDRRG